MRANALSLTTSPPGETDVSVVVERHQGLLVFRFSGQVSVDDIWQVGVWCDEADRTAPGLPRFADATAVTGGHISFAEVVRFTGERRRVPRPAVVRFAVLVGSTLAHDVAQLCQTLLDHPQIDFVVFPDRAAAFAYLNVRDPEDR